MPDIQRASGWCLTHCALLVDLFALQHTSDAESKAESVPDAFHSEANSSKYALNRKNEAGLVMTGKPGCINQDAWHSPHLQGLPRFAPMNDSTHQPQACQ